MRLKANQPALYEGVKLLFDEPPYAPSTVRCMRKRSGEIQRWHLSVSSALNGWADWPHLAQVGKLVHTWTDKGEEKSETSYLIASLPEETTSVAKLLGIMRGHWGIENRLHWVRDVTFDEDRSQVRTRSAPQVMAAMRNAVIGILHVSGVQNIAAALRTLAAQGRRALSLVTSRNPTRYPIMQ